MNARDLHLSNQPERSTDHAPQHRRPFEHRSRSDKPWSFQARHEDDDYAIDGERDDVYDERPTRPLSSARSPPPRYDSRDYTSSRQDPSNTGLRVPSPGNAFGKRHGPLDQNHAHKDPQGLTVLHEPEGELLADLVFVHSLGGGSVRSWSDDGRHGTFWPEDWLAREDLIRSARISTYGYSSQIMTSDADRLLDFSDIAKDLLAKLRFSQNHQGRALNIGRVPLIFVAHSLGGLIAKQAYLLAMSDSNATYGDIAESTAAFVFFSTPHRSMDTNILHDILSAGMPDLQSAFGGDSAKRSTHRLQDLNEKFRDLASALDIYSFYARPMAETDHEQRELTTLEHHSETQIPLTAEHSVINRYSSPNDPNYVSVKGALRVLIEKFKFRRKAPVLEDVALQTA